MARLDSQPRRTGPSPHHGKPLDPDHGHGPGAPTMASLDSQPRRVEIACFHPVRKTPQKNAP